MQCVVCHKDTKVLDSRISVDGFRVRRRRECVKCGFRFSTSEEIEIFDITVVKRDGSREPYDRAKLERSIEKALDKRAVEREDVHDLISRIERDIQVRKRREITSEKIGEFVMEQLKRFDKIAYVRFASVYRQFEDVSQFNSEIESLTKTKKLT
ncbi:MAG: Ribonucleotide reductase regulator NrdR-like protein [Parcubacteria group bacterium GW2011_GWA2_44_12]|nr:MAG: Ribonucleotide reductase regulator NrdR-like protein [Parcubacteria group bacterium GW2011_GWA2_44_12]